MKTVVGGTMLIGGMQSGKSSVALLIRDDNDTPSLAQMSLDHLEMFVRGCRGREAYLAGLGGESA